MFGTLPVLDELCLSLILDLFHFLDSFHYKYTQAHTHKQQLDYLIQVWTSR